jgi:hypothetical protein
MVHLKGRELLLLVSFFTAVVSSSCVPDYPERLLADAAVLQHPSVIAALHTVEQTLSTLYTNTTRDALSFAVVSAPHSPHASDSTLTNYRPMPLLLGLFTPSIMAH